MVAGGVIAAPARRRPIFHGVSSHTAQRDAGPRGLDLSPVPGGSVLVGIDKPDAVLSALRAVPEVEGECNWPVFVLEPDESIPAHAGFEQISAHPRTRVFTGAGCAEALIAWCRDRIEYAPPSVVHEAGSRTADIARHVSTGLRGVLDDQRVATEEIRARLESLGASRGLAYWANRFAAIRDGATPRVMIMTSLFTTFLRFTAEDLAEAFDAGGADARLLIEPDDATAFTPLMVMREIEVFDPDVVLVLNYTRDQLAKYFPEGRPFVCWVQDAMNHMFQPSAGTPSALDFIAGHVYDDSTMRRGYDGDAVLRFPVPVSTRKFAPSPVADTDRERFACDIAYVSHQSEPADRYHTRIATQFPPSHHPALVRCFGRVRDAVLGWSDAAQEHALDAAIGELVENLGQSGDPAAASIVRTQYVHPIAERMLRHQMLGWAGKIAEDRGLRFRLYGSGWDNHPTLARFAHGPVTHGDDLRACYQSAAVHLHASALGCGHQRVIECAFSGGLPLCRRSWDEQYRRDWERMTTFLERGLEPDASLVRWKWPAYAVETHPELAGILRDRDRMPRPEGGWDHEHLGTDDIYAQIGNDPFFQYHRASLPPPHLQSLAIYRDPLELTFSTPEELDALIARAVDDADWRRTKSSEIAQAARDTKSTDRFAQRLMECVGNRLSALAVSKHAAARSAGVVEASGRG